MSIKKYPDEVYKVLHQQVCPLCSNFRMSKLIVEETRVNSFTMECKTCGGKFTRTWKELHNAFTKLAGNKTTTTQARYYGVDFTWCADILEKYTDIGGRRKRQSETKRKAQILKDYLDMI